MSLEKPSIDFTSLLDKINSDNTNTLDKGFESVSVIPPMSATGQLLALYPPIADDTYQFYKFYQIKPGQVPDTNTETDMALVITDNIPAQDGIPIMESSGNDIRVFDSVGLPLEYESINFTSELDDSVTLEIWFKMGTIKVGEWVQLTFKKITATNGQNPPAVFSN